MEGIWPGLLEYRKLNNSHFYIPDPPFELFVHVCIGKLVITVAIVISLGPPEGLMHTPLFSLVPH